MKLYHKINSDDKRIKSTYFIIFILLCIILSRVLMYFSFLMWKERNGVDIGFWEALSRFDTTWYKSIIENGYDIEPVTGDRHDTANWAFFPLFPLIIRFVHYILPFNYDILAFIVNTIFLFLLLIIAVKYIMITRNDRTQIVVYTILITFGMCSFYFSILYTETLFMLLTAAFFYCMQKKKYLLMGVMGAMASATRNMGVMLVFAAAVNYIVEYITFLKQDNRFSFRTLFGRFFGNVRLVLGVSLIPMGLFCYMGYLYFLTGDSLAFVHIQSAWGKEASNPIRVLFNSLTNVDSFVFYLSLAAVWGIYCVWLLIWNKRWAEAAMAFLFVFIPLSTSVDSIPRYIFGSFFPLLGFLDGIGKWQKSKIIALCAFSIIFGGICLWGWFGSEAFVM